MREIKQSTSANIMVWMAASSDHITAKTGLTLTITASKNGAAFASITPTITERGDGWYALALTTSHTDTLGDLALHITGTDADATDLVCRVIAMDKTVANTPANVTQVNGSSVTPLTPETAPENFELLSIDAEGKVSPADGSITTDTLATSAKTAIASTLLSTTNGDDTVATQLQNLDAAVSEAGGGGGTGEGDTAVNHNYGGVDALRVMRGGSPVDGAIIRAYVTDDYAAGTVSLIGKTYTGSDGRWTEPLMLDADDYTILVYDPANRTNKSFTLTVT